MDGSIASFEIEKELGVEIVGETKFKISIEEDEEPWDEILDEIDDNDIALIDKEIKDNYLEESL